jgi:hypothetical protein
MALFCNKLNCTFTITPRNPEMRICNKLNCHILGRWHYTKLSRVMCMKASRLIQFFCICQINEAHQKFDVLYERIEVAELMLNL